MCVNLYQYLYQSIERGCVNLDQYLYQSISMCVNLYQYQCVLISVWNQVRDYTIVRVVLIYTLQYIERKVKLLLLNKTIVVIVTDHPGLFRLKVWKAENSLFYWSYFLTSICFANHIGIWYQILDVAVLPCWISNLVNRIQNVGSSSDTPALVHPPDTTLLQSTLLPY